VRFPVCHSGAPFDLALAALLVLLDLSLFLYWSRATHLRCTRAAQTPAAARSARAGTSISIHDKFRPDPGDDMRIFSASRGPIRLQENMRSPSHFAERQEPGPRNSAPDGSSLPMLALYRLLSLLINDWSALIVSDDSAPISASAVIPAFAHSSSCSAVAPPLTPQPP
jgi:hypothetical protein